jgi:hypothetical protein
MVRLAKEKTLLAKLLNVVNKANPASLYPAAMAYLPVS